MNIIQLLSCTLYSYPLYNCSPHICHLYVMYECMLVCLYTHINPQVVNLVVLRAFEIHEVFQFRTSSQHLVVIPRFLFLITQCVGWETTHSMWNSWGAEIVVNTHVSVRLCTYTHTYAHIRARAHTHTHTHTHIYIYKTLLVQTWELEYLEFRLMVFDFFFSDCFMVSQRFRNFLCTIMLVHN